MVRRLELCGPSQLFKDLGGMRRYLLLALLCFGSSLLGSAVTVGFFIESGNEGDLDAALTVDELRAGRVVLVDSEGRTRLVLAANPVGPDDVMNMIGLYDVNGIRKLSAGMNGRGYPFLMLENSELPSPEHKRIELKVEETVATLRLGHGDISEIELQSARPADSIENRIQLRARNSSRASFYVDDFGHATFEIEDNAANSVVRIPVQRDLVPAE